MKHNSSNIPSIATMKCYAIFPEPNLEETIDKLIDSIPEPLKNSEQELVLYLGKIEYLVLKPFIKKGMYRDFPVKIHKRAPYGQFWITVKS